MCSMEPKTAEALRTAVAVQAGLISDLEAAITDIQSLKAAKETELTQHRAKAPMDFATEARLRGEITALEQMTVERAGSLTAAREELARLEGQGRQEAAIERIQAITEEALAFRLRRELEVRELMEFLARELPQLVKPDSSYTALKNELRGLLLEGYSVHLDNDFDDLNHTREKAYRELEGRGVDMATVQSMSYQARPHHFKPVPLDRVDTAAGAGRYYELAKEVYDKALPIVEREASK